MQLFASPTRFVYLFENEEHSAGLCVYNKLKKVGKKNKARLIQVTLVEQTRQALD
jgi:hypothetical protein